VPMVLHPYQVDLIKQWTDPFIKTHATCIAAGGAETTPKTTKPPPTLFGHLAGVSMERMTGIEPATSTLARLRSTN